MATGEGRQRERVVDGQPARPQPVRRNADEKTDKKRRRGVDVPHEVATNILTRLPVKTLLRFRCVSKHWRASIEEPRFVSAHLEASRAARPGSISVNKREQKLFCVDTNGVVTLEMTLPPEMGLLGGYDITQLESCNGLVLASTSTQVLVCNPATRRVLILPEFNLQAPPPWRYPDTPLHLNSICGLGFDPLSQQYKVLHMADFMRSDDRWDCEILTLGADPSSSWRTIRRSPLPVKGTFHHACLDGVLYWMTPSGPDNVTKYVVSFDLRVEKFRIIALPRRLTFGHVDLMNVAVLDRQLYVAETESSNPQDRKVLHLWALIRDPSKRKRGWYTQYIDPPFDFEEPIHPVAKHRGEILINEPAVRLYYYNPHDGTFRNLRMAPDDSPLGPVVDHIESLVWPLQLK